MRNLLIHLFGRQFMLRTLGPHTQSGGVLDIRFGLNLLKDRRVPVASKLLALGAGLLACVVLIALEIPLEGVIALLLPVVGLFSDVVVDGLEVVIVPIAVAALILPRLAPAHLVENYRASAARQVPYHDVTGA